MSRTLNRPYALSLGLALAVALLILMLAPATIVAEPDTVTASDHLIKNIRLTPENPNFVRSGQDVTVEFDYQTVEASGVRIFARPFSGGSPSSGYLAGGSPNYPVGSGSGSNSFTFAAGNLTVDEIRLQMFSADQSDLLFEAYIPVHYEITSADDPVYDIELDPLTPNVMRNGEQVNVKFKYISDQPEGVRIFVRPYSGGEPSPDYGAHGSPVYPAGSGSGTGFFRINSGDVLVDAIRVQMTNANQTLLLFEGFLPVHYQYGGGPHRVFNLDLAPATPNILDLGENVNLTFDYTTNFIGGVTIVARPMKYGELAPGFLAHGSPLYPVGSGSGSGFFTINVDPLVVDGVRLQMVSADGTLLLFETVVPVHYQFGEIPAVIHMPIVLSANGE